MIVTEQEAKEKWCPQGHYHKEDYAKETATPKCAGSGCMMWRWYSKSKCVKEREIKFGTSSPPVYEKMPREEWTGYCGLGGKP